MTAIEVTTPPVTVAVAVAAAAEPTLKMGAGNDAELLSWVMPSLSLAPVSLLASRTAPAVFAVAP